ncbi:MAG TPA: oligosaccharide flippase family protein [Aquamicrobium sp.]|nr:oligosaccharide flippase family protein [Aquamicrobium sp.]
MKISSTALYFGSRTVAAIGNLISVAVFTHFIGPEEYGAYVLVFAWVIIVYGFTTQWMKFAYFGVYRAAQAGALIATYGRLALGVVAVASAAIAVTAMLTPMGGAFAAALVALFAGMTIYEAATEISRTRLQAGAVALCMVLRAAFVLALGAATLSVWPSAIALALAVAAGHLLAAVPSLISLRGFARAQPSREEARGLVRYGWPLIFSFGITALGFTTDRLIIAYFAGNAVLGPYGVVADLMRQSFMVAGESIALALVTIAKQQADEGRRAQSDATMRLAFRACVTAAAFGAAFFIIFGEKLVAILLGEGFAQPAYEIIPWIACAFFFMTIRVFYFSQVIYFIDATVIDPIVNVFFVVVSVVIALVLVPRAGAAGGAAALAIAHAGACVVAAFAGRRYYKLPVERAALFGIPALALLALAGAWGLSSALDGAALWAGEIALFAAAALVAAWRFDLFSLVIVGAGRQRAAS